MISILIFAGLAISWVICDILNKKPFFLLLSILGIAYAMYSEWDPFYFSTQLLDHYPGLSALKLGIILFSFLTMLLSYASLEKPAKTISLTFFSTVGALVMLSSTHLIVLFLGLEMMSIPIYVLAGSKKDSVLSIESSLKYFILGSVASAIFLFGIALLYAGTGSLFLPYHIHTVASIELVKLSSVFLLCGLAFKVGLIPFHNWISDVYQGSPSRYTFLMTSMVKMAAFGIMYMILSALLPISYVWSTPLSVMALVSLFIGNSLAVKQRSLKRLFAYSSIAQAGTITLAFLPLTFTSIVSISYYLLAYALASGALFFVLSLCEDLLESDSIDVIHNIKSSPLLLATFVISLLSLAGIPPLAGFFAKYLILSHLFHTHQMAEVCFAAISFMIGFWAYFNVLFAVFTKQQDKPAIQLNFIQKALAVFFIASITLAGLFPHLIKVLIKL